VRELLTENFVLCADEVWRLQHLDAPDCVHFRTFCDEGEFGRLNAQDESRTRQGTYCVSPSGVLLGSANHRDPRRIERLLRSSLAKWEELSKSERLLETDPRETLREIERPEYRFPEDGVAVRINVRDLPRTYEGAEALDANDWRTHAWNFDYAWFNAEEVRRLVPEGLSKGDAWELDPALVERTFRLHLVDIARGQTLHYARDQVRAATLRAEVVKVRRGVAELALTGEIHLVDEDAERGIRGTLLGTASVRVDERDFAELKLVCVAERWGTTQFNRRHDDLGPEPIGFALHLATDHPTEKVAPTAFWEYGWR